jgi:hypothetical protein
MLEPFPWLPFLSNPQDSGWEGPSAVEFVRARPRSSAVSFRRGDEFYLAVMASGAHRT